MYATCLGLYLGHPRACPYRHIYRKYNRNKITCKDLSI